MLLVFLWHFPLSFAIQEGWVFLDSEKAIILKHQTGEALNYFLTQESEAIFVALDLLKQ